MQFGFSLIISSICWTRRAYELTIGQCLWALVWIVQDSLHLRYMLRTCTVNVSDTKQFVCKVEFDISTRYPLIRTVARFKGDEILQTQTIFYYLFTALHDARWIIHVWHFDVCSLQNRSFFPPSNRAARLNFRLPVLKIHASWKFLVILIFIWVLHNQILTCLFRRRKRR